MNYVRSRRGREEENASKFVPSHRRNQPTSHVRWHRFSASVPLSKHVRRCPSPSETAFSRSNQSRWAIIAEPGTLCNRFCISSSSSGVASVRSLLLPVRTSSPFGLCLFSSTWFLRRVLASTALLHKFRLFLCLFVSIYLLPVEKFPPLFLQEKQKGLERYGTLQWCKTWKKRRALIGEENGHEGRGHTGWAAGEKREKEKRKGKREKKKKRIVKIEEHERFSRTRCWFLLLLLLSHLDYIRLARLVRFPF